MQIHEGVTEEPRPDADEGEERERQRVKREKKKKRKGRKEKRRWSGFKTNSRDDSNERKAFM